ncbi:MAG: putative molybdenum carrier protein [Planctomycetota bacterium]
MALIRKIVSGGQTGVDRAALDAAIFLDLEHGGWCPAGRRAEDGRIPARYLLIETSERDYSVRTEKNVVESDATLILFCNQLTGGTLLTLRLAQKHFRPYLCIDLEEFNQSSVKPRSIVHWIVDQNVSVLNVAGPRESSWPGIGKKASAFLIEALRVQETF